MKRLYVVTKYVRAETIEQAIKLARNVKPDDVYLDNDWRKSQLEFNGRQIGFKKKI